MRDLMELRTRAQSALGEKRYRHCVGVEETAVRFGKMHGLDMEKLRIAALLHDIGKSLSPDEQVIYAGQNHLFLSDDDKKAKGIIHSIIGGRIAETDFGIADGDILRAIRFHTTGCADMSLFQKVLFASDYLEPYRGFENQQELLKRTMEKFEEGVLAIIADKIAFVLKKGEHLHPLSVDFYNRQLLTVRESRQPT